MSGWEEFDSHGWTAIWGLIIASSGGFHFHHFPQRSWIDARGGGGREEPKEKTIFLPKENIISAELVTESRWWKKLFAPSPPRLILNYHNTGETTCRLFFDVEINSGDPKFRDLAGQLNGKGE